MPKSLLHKTLLVSLSFYILSGLTSLLNYIFYPLIARFVSVSQYGEIQFLVSMFTQLAIGFIVLNILAVIISSRSQTSEERDESVSYLNVIASSITLVIVLVGTFILYMNQESLGFSDNLAIFALGCSFIVSVPFIISIGKLQGNGQFVASGVINLLASLFKLLFSITMVLVGIGVAGAIFGIALGMLAALLVLKLIDKNVKQRRSPLANLLSATKNVRKLSYIKEQAIVALFTLLIITLLSSADSIVSRLVLSSYEAGQYAAVATISKTILAITSPLMWLALPPSVARQRRQVIKLILITIVISAIASVIFLLFPNVFIQGLIGINAGAFTTLLAPSLLAMTLSGIAFILIGVNICIGALKNITISSGIAIVLYISTLFLLGPSAGLLQASLYGQIISVLVLCFGGTISLHSRYFQQRT